MNPFGNKAISEIIVEEQQRMLEQVPPPKIIKYQHAKDKNKKRRAKNQIANASRRRNRK